MEKGEKQRDRTPLHHRKRKKVTEKYSKVFRGEMMQRSMEAGENLTFSPPYGNRERAGKQWRGGGKDRGEDGGSQEDVCKAAGRQ